MGCATTSIRASATARPRTREAAPTEVLTETATQTLSPAAVVEARAALSVNTLSKTYPIPFTRLRQFFRRKAAGPVEALKGVSLEIREGEIFGLIGRNGAGKTTLAKIIATLVQPTSGSVLVYGFDSVRDEEQVRARVGLASAEERSFYWRLTIEQNLLFFARLYGMSDRAARRRIDELIVLLGLEQYARRRFGQLSTGNKQRVIVARAMLSDPPVLLLDEPTRSLDPLAAAETRKIIRALAASRPAKTVLLTSHNLAEIEELCERVAVISRGRICALGTPRQLRLLHRASERVRLLVCDVARARLESDLAGAGLGAVEVADDAAGAGVLCISFTREVEDFLLDRAVRAIQEGGGRIVSCDVERATLLDVLERYERDDADGVRDEVASA